MTENYENLRIISGSQIEPKEVDWLWYPYIPYGKICFLQVQIPEMGVRTFFWTVSTPVTSVIVKQTFFLKIAVACKYLISKDWLCLAIEL